MGYLERVGGGVWDEYNQNMLYVCMKFSKNKLKYFKKTSTLQHRFMQYSFYN